MQNTTWLINNLLHGKTGLLENYDIDLFLYINDRVAIATRKIPEASLLK